MSHLWIFLCIFWTSYVHPLFDTLAYFPNTYEVTPCSWQRRLPWSQKILKWTFKTWRWRKTKKSSLYQIFQTIPEKPATFTDSEFILDEGNLFNRVIWPTEGTFGDVFAIYVKFIRKHYGQRVTVVLDKYGENSNSTKSIERQQVKAKHK